MVVFGWLIVYIIVPLFFSPILLVYCGGQSKKKFETDGRVELVPRPAASTSKSLSSGTPMKSSKQLKPTEQVPPPNTPVERSGGREEDTLANVQSLQPESSDGPMAKKGKKK